MHLVVLGMVTHLYHIQRALAQVGADRAWLSLDFNRKNADWRILEEQTADRPTQSDKIVCRKPTHLGFCNALNIGAGGMLLDPSCFGKDLV